MPQGELSFQFIFLNVKTASVGKMRFGDKEYVNKIYVQQKLLFIFIDRKTIVSVVKFLEN